MMLRKAKSRLYKADALIHLGTMGTNAVDAVVLIHLTIGLSEWTLPMVRLLSQHDPGTVPTYFEKRGCPSVAFHL